MTPLRMATFQGPLAQTWTARLEERLRLLPEPPVLRIHDLGPPGVPSEDLDRILEAILRSGADTGVTSAASLPTELPHDLTVGAVLRYKAPEYACVARRRPVFSLLPAGSRVATSCPLARAQILFRFPWLFVQLSGPEDAIVSGLHEGLWDAACVSPEALDAVPMDGLNTEPVAPDILMPPIGQGAVALLVRKRDGEAALDVGMLNDPTLESCWLAERSFAGLASRFPAALPTARARRTGDQVHITGMIIDRNGSWLVDDEAVAAARFAVVVAEDLAEACRELARSESVRPGTLTTGVSRS